MSKHRTILQDINEFEFEVKKCVKAVAKETFKQVVFSSPEPMNPDSDYSLGSYILSHNIVFNGIIDQGVVELKNEEANAAGKAMVKANKIKILDIVIGKDVVVSNSTKYNDFIEYTGWFGEGPKGPYKGTPPYAPYRKAYQSSSAYAEGRVKQV